MNKKNSDSNRGNIKILQFKYAIISLFLLLFFVSGFIVDLEAKSLKGKIVGKLVDA